MSFDATCCCPNCKTFWYECADENEKFDCPNCGYKDIEPEELDLVSSFDFDEEDEAAVIEYLRKWDERRQIRLKANNGGMS